SSSRRHPGSAAAGQKPSPSPLSRERLPGPLRRRRVFLRCFPCLAEGHRQQLRDETGKASRPTFALHDPYLVFAHIVTGAAQTGSDDRDEIARRQPAAAEAARKLRQVLRGKCAFEFCQRSPRQAEPVFTSIQNCGHLAAPPVRAHVYTAVKVTGPADSSAISKVTSPS